MSTHAHYPGEFGARRQTSTLAKDPAYRAARAEHFAREAQHAGEAHRVAESPSDRAAHALVVAHAHQMARKHARAAEKMAPGTEHARYAREASAEASRQHESVLMREATPGAKQTQKIQNKSMREIAVSQPHTEQPKLSAEEARRTAEVHEQMKTPDIFKRVQRHEDVVMGKSTQVATQPLPVKRTGISDEHLARLAQDAANKAPVEHGFGDRKVFIHRVHQAIETHVPGMTLHEFKDRVRSMSKARLLTTHRADLVAAMNKHDVERSHTTLTGATHDASSRAPHVNFIGRQPGHEVSAEKLAEHEKIKESMGHQHWRETDFSRAAAATAPRVTTATMGDSPHHANVASQRADKASASAKTPTEHMVAASMHEAAASAQTHVGNHEAAMRHLNAAADHRMQQAGHKVRYD